ncbi:MAG: nicotinate-nucleotide adenylyltransferase [Christensenellaceae bacterium]|jgi:nicotinate-nucleotide adenylyltransferase
MMELFKRVLSEDDVRLDYPRKKYGVFGGTFNPVHNGHIDMALRIKDEFDLLRMVLIPCGSPPHKLDEQMASKYARLQMTALAVREYPALEVSDIEVKRIGYTYTVDTLRELHKTCTDTDFYFVIGSDTLFELPSWKDFAAVCRLTNFICVPRYRYEDLKLSAQAAKLHEEYGARIEVSSVRGMAVSSSEVRERLEKDLPVDHMLPRVVKEYIIENGLYKNEG